LRGVADLALVFRAHGFLIYDGETQDYYDALYSMLKPGGMFGIVDHRGDEAVAQDLSGVSGYVNQSHVIGLATQAGFQLVASSEINANGKDSKNHPDGVYSLPPTLRGTMFSPTAKRRYLEIGESDRMTLRFRKP
jgi:predicted methyltransferase